MVHRLALERAQQQMELGYQVCNVQISTVIRADKDSKHFRLGRGVLAHRGGGGATFMGDPFQC